MDILNYTLSFSLGLSLMYIYFHNLMYKKLQKDYENMKNRKTEISQGDYDDMVKLKDNDISKLKSKLSEYIDKNENLLSQLDSIKLHIGLVDDHEYGILHSDSIVSGTANNRVNLDVRCGFKVIQKGSNKVRISVNINDINSTTILEDKVKKNVVELLNGWYNINNDNITWIEPDKSLKRDIILGDLT